MPENINIAVLYQIIITLTVAMVTAIAITIWYIKRLDKAVNDYKELKEKFFELKNNASQNKASEESILQYLSSQLGKTSQQAVHKGCNSKQLRLRSDYLKIEKQAYEKKGDSKQFWFFLEENLKNLLSKHSTRELIPTAIPPPQPPPKKTFDMQEIIGKQNTIISDLRQKIEEFDKKYSQSKKDNIVDERYKIIKEELEKTITHNKQLKEELKRALAINDTDTITQENPTIERLQDKLQKHKEIKSSVVNLEGIIGYQKKTIAKLEDEVSQLRLAIMEASGTESSAENSQHVEKLKQTLVETETCVTILEQEMDNMRAKIQEMKDYEQLNINYIEKELTVLKDSQKNTDTEADPKNQNGDITTKDGEESTNELYERLDWEVARYAIASLNIKTVEDLARDMVNRLKKNKVECSIKIQSEFFNFETESNEFSNESNKQYKRANFTDQLTVDKINKGYILTLKNIILMAGVGYHEEKIENFIRSFVYVASRSARSIDQDYIISEKEKTITGIRNETIESIKGINVQYKYQIEESSKILNRVLKELSTMLSSMSLNEKQNDIINNIIEESKNRVNILFSSGVSVEKSVSDILENLENS